MQLKERRKHLRVPLLSEVIYIKTMDEFIVCPMLDISETGVFVKTDVVFKHKDQVKIRFLLPGDLGMLLLDSEVVRVNWAESKKKGLVKGIALKFNNLEDYKVKILHSYAIYLRNKQIITVSKRIIEEFFADRHPNE